jgi:hypothetical protein
MPNGAFACIFPFFEKRRHEFSAFVYFQLYGQRKRVEFVSTHCKQLHPTHTFQPHSINEQCCIPFPPTRTKISD